MTDTKPVEWMGGYTREDIDHFAETGHVLNLGNIYSGHSSAEDNRDEFTQTIDCLLKLFRINPTDWRDRIVRARGTIASALGAVGVRQYDKRELQRRGTNKGLGEFVLDRAYWAVPIEGDEDQTGEFELTLQLDETVFATLSSYGEQEVYRHYIDPNNGKKVTGDLAELEERAIKGELDTDIAEVHTSISYRVAFSVVDSRPTPTIS